MNTKIFVALSLLANTAFAGDGTKTQNSSGIVGAMVVLTMIVVATWLATMVAKLIVGRIVRILPNAKKVAAVVVTLIVMLLPTIAFAGSGSGSNDSGPSCDGKTSVSVDSPSEGDANSAYTPEVSEDALMSCNNSAVGNFAWMFLLLAAVVAIMVARRRNTKTTSP